MKQDDNLIEKRKLIINKDSNELKKNKKSKKSRCNFDGCNKKLTLVDKSIICKCQKVFCPKHRISVNHNCEIKINKEEFIKNKGLGGGVYDKLVKI